MASSEEARHAYAMWRRVRRSADKGDPRLSAGECDGYLFDGAVVDVYDDVERPGDLLAGEWPDPTIPEN